MQLRLNQAKERLKDIDLKLEDPDVVKDLDAFRKLSKEKANLDPIIEKYDEYLKLVSDKEDALLMLKDSDEEIIKFAKETIDNIDKELIVIEEQLKILLTKLIFLLAIYLECMLNMQKRKDGSYN